MNDLPNSLNILKAIRFAGGAMVYPSPKPIHDLVNRVYQELRF